MRALTFHRPWDRLVAKGLKLVENRSWMPTYKQLAPGDVFAVHQGKKWDAENCKLTVGDLLKRMPNGPEILRVLDLAMGEGGEGGQIVGVVEYRGCTVADPSPWFSGPIGWGLADPFELPTPIPCRGFQGLWTVPADVQAQIDRQLAGVYP